MVTNVKYLNLYEVSFDLVSEPRASSECEKLKVLADNLHDAIRDAELVTPSLRRGMVHRTLQVRDARLIATNVAVVTTEGTTP